MDITLLFAGAFVSVLVQFIKSYTGTNKSATMAVVLILSAVAGTVSWYLHRAGLWDSFMQIALGAGTMYAFVLKNIEDSKK